METLVAGLAALAGVQVAGVARVAMLGGVMAVAMVAAAVGKVAAALAGWRAVMVVLEAELVALPAAVVHVAERVGWAVEAVARAVVVSWGAWSGLGTLGAVPTAARAVATETVAVVATGGVVLRSTLSRRSGRRMRRRWADRCRRAAGMPEPPLASSTRATA